MKKILYIRIDNTPIPQILKKDIVEFDCQHVNDFCSFVGDAIVGELRAEDGTPFYRLVSPLGQLLMNFKVENSEKFDAIIAQWADILGDIMHNGISEKESYMIKFPQEYVDWLCQHEDNRYSYVGDNLKRNNSIVSLDARELNEDIISILRLKIERYLESNQDNFDYIVFSNPRIGNCSEGVKQLKDVFDCFRFIRLEQLTQVFEEERYCGHEYVDLGLSVKWATCNVGAKSPSDYGDYFAWGETKPKTEYLESNSVTYLKPIFEISGNPQYDAACANWGGTWRLPTDAEISELKSKCTCMWTTKNGHAGYLLIGPSGKSIFLPAAGYRWLSSFYSIETSGFYWSSSRGTSRNACLFEFRNGLFSSPYHGRYNGYSVRPVSE